MVSSVCFVEDNEVGHALGGCELGAGHSDSGRWTVKARPVPSPQVNEATMDIEIIP